MFYTYNQNNSGGGFDFNNHAGISTYVIIEADDAEEADGIAQRAGLYFDGIEKGIDCDCCGDRWYNAYGDGDSVPSLYGESIETHELGMKWQSEGDPEIFIHFKNGMIVGA